MRKTSKFAILIVTLGLSATTAAAQAPPSVGCAASTDPTAPLDFLVCGNIDAVASAAPGDVTTSGSVNLGMWLFECRSGLQPVTQRPGTVTAYWWRLLSPQHGQIETVIVLPPATAYRPDVAAAYAPTCPAVGPYVGLNFSIPPPPEAGTWTLDLVVSTADGAGRRIDWRGRREGIIVNW